MKRLIKWMLFSVVVITSSKSNAQGVSNVLDSYLVLKDALVESDAELATNKANNLMIAISKVDVKSLNEKEASVFNSLHADLLKSTSKISKSKKIDDQRKSFAELSEMIYKLVKVSKASSEVYYQRCPMYQNGKGANWLSKDASIRNPYFGSKMLSCGKTLETIK